MGCVQPKNEGQKPQTTLPPKPDGISTDDKINANNKEQNKEAEIQKGQTDLQAQKQKEQQEQQKKEQEQKELELQQQKLKQEQEDQLLIEQKQKQEQEQKQKQAQKEIERQEQYSKINCKDYINSQNLQEVYERHSKNILQFDQVQQNYNNDYEEKISDNSRRAQGNLNVIAV